MQRIEQPRQRWPPQTVVGVEHEKKRLGAVDDPRIARHRKTLVAVVPHHLRSREARRVALEEVHGALPAVIGRAVIDHNHGQCGKVLSDDGFESFRDRVGIVVKRDHDDGLRLACAPVFVNRLGQALDVEYSERARVENIVHRDRFRNGCGLSAT